MYDSFDNMYQATIGIDFLSKARTLALRVPVGVAPVRVLTDNTDNVP